MSINDNYDPAFERYVDEAAGYETRRSRKIPEHRDPDVWTSADGKKTPIHDMGDRHLLNTIAFVERSYRDMQDTFRDGALDIDRLWPQHAALVAEARRRGLDPKEERRPVGDGVSVAGDTFELGERHPDEFARNDVTFRAFAEATSKRTTIDFGEALDAMSKYGPEHWALMIQEEAGEVAGAVIGMLGMKKRKNHLTAVDVGKEIADVVAYCACLAIRCGLDFQEIVRVKFNAVSDRVGSAVRL